jgi:hypothetical protein
VFVSYNLHKYLLPAVSYHKTVSLLVVIVLQSENSTKVLYHCTLACYTTSIYGQKSAIVAQGKGAANV